MSAPTARPLLRGYLHAGAAVLSVFGWAYLVVLSRDDAPRLASMLVYGAGLTILFTVSAVSHLRAWGPASGAILRRIDHASIFVLIASTYTPIAFNLLSGAWRLGVLATIWALAVVGAALAVAGVQLGRRLRVAVYIAMGWIAGVAVGQIDAALPAGATAALVAGGVLYTGGAVLYALRWPDPWPHVFGYHEVFHLFTIVAAALFYALILVHVLPAPRP